MVVKSVAVLVLFAVAYEWGGTLGWLLAHPLASEGAGRVMFSVAFALVGLCITALGWVAGDRVAGPIRHGASRGVSRGPTRCRPHWPVVAEAAGRRAVRRLDDMAEVDLTRFLDGYRESFDQALAEIRRGRKRSHWMWFIFPQIAGLGTSPTAVHYAIRNRAEADAFLTDPTLGAGYRELVDAVWTQVVTNRVSVHSCSAHPMTTSSCRR